jgi:hypothetical protein
MHITMEQAHDALVWAVDQRGEDYVDPAAVNFNGGGCKYVVDGQPGCIIGMALSHLGVSLDVLIAMDDDDDPTITVGGGSVLGGSGITLDRQALAAFKEAQAAQDVGSSWGVAVQAGLHAA